MLEFTGNCAIKLYTYVTNIPMRIAEKRMKEETRQQELLNKKFQMVVPVLREIVKNKLALEKMYLEQAKQRLSDEVKLKVDRFRTRTKNPGLMDLARQYAHCTMNDKTSIQFKGESYLLKPLLSGVIIRIE